MNCTPKLNNSPDMQDVSANSKARPVSRHFGRNCRNPDCMDSSNPCHPWHWMPAPLRAWRTFWVYLKQLANEGNSCQIGLTEKIDRNTPQQNLRIGTPVHVAKQMRKGHTIKRDFGQKTLPHLTMTKPAGVCFDPH